MLDKRCPCIDFPFVAAYIAIGVFNESRILESTLMATAMHISSVQPIATDSDGCQCYNWRCTSSAVHLVCQCVDAAWSVDEAWPEMTSAECHHHSASNSSAKERFFCTKTPVVLFQFKPSRNYLVAVRQRV